MGKILTKGLYAGTILIGALICGWFNWEMELWLMIAGTFAIIDAVYDSKEKEEKDGKE